MSNLKFENGRFVHINELYAFISKDKNGTEGIMGAMGVNGVMMPLIGADIDRVESLKPIADEIKKLTGMDYEIRHFILRI